MGGGEGGRELGGKEKESLSRALAAQTDTLTYLPLSLQAKMSIAEQRPWASQFAIVNY